ncbi:MAG: hypothetical protein ABIC40_08510, partial [bacterium]
MVFNRIIPIIFAITCFAIFSGCVRTADPVMPGATDTTPARITTTESHHTLLGTWQFFIDSDKKDISVAPLRTAMLHMNGVKFMEPPANVNLKIDKIVKFLPGDVTVDIAIKHPYATAKHAAAFDVCGIVIGHGSLLFPLTDDLYFADENQVHLANPDGFTRWWNPVEFPYNAAQPQFGYKDGLLGKPNSTENFTARLNGYKYFATGLAADAPLSEIDTAMRGAFVPGTTCIRRYELIFPAGNLVFNYAVDANWAKPSVIGPNTQIPGDFPPEANRDEPYRIEITDLNNTLTYNSSTGVASGSCTFTAYEYDWYGADENMLCAFAQNDELMG